MSEETGTPGRTEMQAYKADPANVSSPTANYKEIEKQYNAEILTTQKSLVDDVSDLVDVAKVSAKSFGATGDGVTDDTANLQLVFDSLTSGGDLYFPTGTYLITDEIEIKGHNLTIEGEGGATIKLKDGNYSAQADFYMLKASNFDYIKIYNLGFDGNRANVTSPTGNASAVYLNNTLKSEISHCISKNMFGGTAGLNAVFSFIGSSLNYICSNNHIYNDSYDASFLLSGGIFFQGSKGVASNNVCEFLNDVAIVANGPGSVGFVFNNNIVVGCGGGGIGAENGSTEVTISGNTIRSIQGGYGIGVLWIGTPGTNSSKIAITGNTISNNNGSDVFVGIALQPTDNVSVTGNSIQSITTANAQNTGITAIGCSIGVVSGNIINGGLFGIKSDGNVKMTFDGNTVISGSSGIILSNVNTVVAISGNHFSAAEGVSVQGGATITNCTVADNIVVSTSKDYALGTTTNIRTVIPQAYDAYLGTFDLGSPTAIGAGLSVLVSLDIGATAYAGGPFVDTGTVSYIEAVADDSHCVCVFATWANSGVTAQIRVYNFSGVSKNVQVFQWRAFGKISNYQK